MTALTVTGHATVLLVENVRRATADYRDALGFEVGLRDIRVRDVDGYVVAFGEPLDANERTG